MEHSIVQYSWLAFIRSMVMVYFSMVWYRVVWLHWYGVEWYSIVGVVQYGWLVVQALADTRSISCTIVWLRDTKSLIDTLKSWTLGQTRKDQ